jgi:hypothetical protein
LPHRRGVYLEDAADDNAGGCDSDFTNFC